MQGTLFYVAIISLLGGVTLGILFDISYMFLVTSLVVSFVFALQWRKNKRWQELFLSVGIIACVCGFVRADIAEWNTAQPVLDTYIEKQVMVNGVVSGEPDVRESTTHVKVSIHTINDTTSSGNILLYAPRTTDVRYGDRIEVSGILQKPTSFTTDLGRTFKYGEYLQAQSVSHVMFYPKIQSVGEGERYALIGYILAFKQNFMHVLEQAIPEPQVGLGEGLLLGVKSALGDELETVFRRTGIIHIVVLSGYNVMLVVVFVISILSYFFGLKTRAVVGVGAIIVFALMVGLSATVVRASIMASLILLAQVTGRTYAVLRALCFAGVVMVLWNPFLLLYDPGFQLSFLATFGLILLAPILEKYILWIPNVVGIRSFLTATLATQIFVLPFLLYQIGELSVVAVLVNVLVLPMVPVAMLLTFITGMVAFISIPIAQIVGVGAYISLEYILVVATFFSEFSYAAFTVPAFTFWIVPVAYGLIGIMIYRVYNPSIHNQNSFTTELSGWTIEEQKDGEEQSSSPSQPSHFFK